MAALRTGAAERFVEIARPRARLRVQEVGSGPPVLFIHGTIGPGAWPSLIAGMPGFRTSRPRSARLGSEQPGRLSARHEYRAFVADLLCGVLDGLGIDRIDVVGGSIGDVGRSAWPSTIPIASDGSCCSAAVRWSRTCRCRTSSGLIRLADRRADRPAPDDRRTDSDRSFARTGTAPSLDAGRIPDELIEWRLALANDTVSMRHERDMVRSILGRSGWQPGFTFDDAISAGSTSRR